MEGLWIILIILAVAAVFAIGIYNGLVQLRNRCDNSWAQVDVQLRRRYDLIPNLVETVKGYAQHERETFQKVTDARAQAINAGNVQEQGQAENMLSGALKSLFKGRPRKRIVRSRGCKTPGRHWDAEQLEHRTRDAGRGQTERACG